MATPIKFSIPNPCHEKWQDMSVADKGRFCGSCQKKVFDFTNASDREIITTYNNNENICARFKPSQLDRDLIIPKEKSSLWMAAASGILGFLSIGNHQAFSQEKNW